jgi:ubiquitin conjugation factor E4 B
MLDPVMLPSSRQIIDRATIARHLLRYETTSFIRDFFRRYFYHSDQSDPFNRNPLRMQDVIPQPELKQTIEEWKASRRRQAS